MSKQKEQFLIWGARGHALVLAEIINLNGDELIAIADIDPDARSPFHGLEVMVGDEGYLKWLDALNRKANLQTNQLSAIAAIGGARGEDRVKYLNKFKSDGFKTPSLIHPKSHIFAGTKIGCNTQVCAFGFLGANTVVGDACIINTKASLDHESVIGNGVHLAPGATICGCTQIGDYSFIGAGATVLPNLKIGINCIIGAGTVVTKDVPDNTIIYDIQSKVIKSSQTM